MYNNGGLGAGGLAATGFGVGFGSVWVFLAAFAVFSALLAVGRVLPTVKRAHR